MACSLSLPTSVAKNVEAFENRKSGLDQTSSIVLADYSEEHLADAGTFSSAVIMGNPPMMVASEAPDTFVDDMGNDCFLFLLATA